MGLLLLVAGFSLVLVPLTLAGTAVGKWENPSLIAAIGKLILMPVLGLWFEWLIRGKK